MNERGFVDEVIDEIRSPQERLLAELDDLRSLRASVIGKDTASEADWLEEMEQEIDAAGLTLGENHAWVVRNQLTYLQEELEKVIRERDTIAAHRAEVERKLDQALEERDELRALHLTSQMKLGETMSERDELLAQSRASAFALVEAELRAIPDFDHVVLQCNGDLCVVAINEEEQCGHGATTLLAAVDALKAGG